MHIAFISLLRYATHMDTAKILEIDGRALRLGLTLSELARLAKVSSATMAKLHKDPSSVRPRTFSKLLSELDKRESEA